MRRLSDLWGDCPEELAWQGRVTVAAMFVVGLLLLSMVPGK